MEPIQYEQFNSSDIECNSRGHNILLQKAGMQNKLAYLLYGLLLLLLFILLMMSGVKFSVLSQEIADVKLYLQSINPSATNAQSTLSHSDSSGADPVRGSCDEGSLYFQGSCYLVSTQRTSWNSAEERCVQHGAHLAIIKSQEELDYLSLITQHAQYWIGLMERQEGLWTWVDGTNLSAPTFWDIGQPDNWDVRVNGEDCGQLHPEKGKSERKLWNDADCTLPFKYICEAKAKKNLPT